MQEKNETFYQFVNKLRKLASTCEYGPLLNEMLRDKIVIGVKCHKTRARLLRVNNLTLEHTLNICRTSEVAEAQLQKIDHSAETVHFAKSNNQSDKPGNRPHVIIVEHFTGRADALLMEKLAEYARGSTTLTKSVSSETSNRHKRPKRSRNHMDRRRLVVVNRKYTKWRSSAVIRA